jgi:hypothetical protein
LASPEAVQYLASTDRNSLLSTLSSQIKLQSELKGAVAATLPGLINAISPVLLFVSLMGPTAVMAGFWASLVSASLVPALVLLFRGQAAVMPTVRTASLVAYISLVAQMCQAMGATSDRFRCSS